MGRKLTAPKAEDLTLWHFLAHFLSSSLFENSTDATTGTLKSPYCCSIRQCYKKMLQDDFVAS